MTSGEPHEFSEDTHHLAEGLRRLAQDMHTPADILPSVLARSEPFIPARRSFWTYLTHSKRRWLLHPVLWGPALAVASFVAGVFVAPSQLDAPVQTVSTEKQKVFFEPQTAPPAATLSRQERALPDVAPTQQEYAQDRRARRAAKTATSTLRQPAEPEAASTPLLQQRGDIAPTTLQHLGSLEERERLPAVAVSAQDIEVTVSLPLTLYEHLLERAENDPDRLAHMLREAVETYARTRDTGEQ